MPAKPSLYKIVTYPYVCYVFVVPEVKLAQIRRNGYAQIENQRRKLTSGMIETRTYGDVHQFMMRPDIDNGPAYWVSAYFVDGLLIDSGCALCAAEFLTALEGFFPTVGVNTHYHEDHVGANRLISEKHGVEWMAHADSVPLIRETPELPWYREAAWGMPENSCVQPVPPMIRTDRFEFEVVDTPGHSPGHIALVERRTGWCFSGDLYVGSRLDVAGPETDIPAMVDSMKRLMAIDSDAFTLFTSMRRVESDGRKALEKAVDYLETLCVRARELQRQGHELVAIRDKILGGPNPLDSITAGRFSTLNLIEGALAADR